MRDREGFCLDLCFRRLAESYTEVITGPKERFFMIDKKAGEEHGMAGTFLSGCLSGIYL